MAIIVRAAGNSAGNRSDFTCKRGRHVPATLVRNVYLQIVIVYKNNVKTTAQFKLGCYGQSSLENSKYHGC
jgi:hypothetical protein